MSVSAQSNIAKHLSTFLMTIITALILWEVSTLQAVTVKLSAIEQHLTDDPVNARQQVVLDNHETRIKKLENDK